MQCEDHRKRTAMIINEKRVAVVTGGNRGIGLEVCRQLAKAGLDVVLCSRDESIGAHAAKSLSTVGLEVNSHQLDVTSDDSVRSLIDDVGEIDVLINNAGLLLDEDGDVLKIGVQSFRDSIETNVYGPLRLAQAIMPEMIDRGYGRIVNVSS